MFEQAPETDEGGIARAGRLLGLGLATDPIRFGRRGISGAAKSAEREAASDLAKNADDAVRQDRGRPGIGHNRSPRDEIGTALRPAPSKLRGKAFTDFVSDLFAGKRKPRGEMLVSAN